MKQFLYGILVTIAVLAIAVGAYYLGQRDKAEISTEGPTATTSPVPLPSRFDPIDKSTDTTPGESKKTNEEIKKIAITAISNGDYEDLLPYLADTVFVRLESSSCCGLLTPAEAVSQLSYLDSAVGPWDFDPTNPIVVELAGASEFYTTPYITGVATNELAVSFRVDPSGEIDAMNLMATYKLLLP